MIRQTDEEMSTWTWFECFVWLIFVFKFIFKPVVCNTLLKDILPWAKKEGICLFSPWSDGYFFHLFYCITFICVALNARDVKG